MKPFTRLLGDSWVIPKKQVIFAFSFFMRLVERSFESFLYSLETNDALKTYQFF